MRTVLGIERIDEFKEVFKGKRVGLLTNPTGIDSGFNPSIALLKNKTALVALFSPEHGVRGDVQAGVHVPQYLDEIYQLPVYSLYGQTRKPTKEMLEEIDVFAIDIQDVGSRFYTYIYSMAYIMQACQEFGKTVVVFDRPNPIGGEAVEGNILDLRFRSFIGYYPIVQRHGMTIGEIAKMFNEEFGIGCNLTVIPMLNWNRKMFFEDTNLPWVFPSPNIPKVDTAFVYNTTCIFEGTNVSEGRGTAVPFEIAGAPWVKPEKLADALNSYRLPGVHFRPLYYTPTFSKYKDELCGGVFVHVTDRNSFLPVKTGWTMLEVILTMYPDHFKVSPPYTEGRPCMLEFNSGCDYIKNRTKSLAEQWEILDKDTLFFQNQRKKYLLY
jgi:uncharacterized protein YbbC (DUF1343 family)